MQPLNAMMPRVIIPPYPLDLALGIYHALHTYSLMYDRHGGLLCPVDCTVSGWPHKNYRVELPGGVCNGDD